MLHHCSQVFPQQIPFVQQRLSRFFNLSQVDGFGFVAGGKRGEFNQRFGQPSNLLEASTGSLFPFADIDQTDPDVTTPADQVVSSGDPAGAAVNFSPTGSDATSGIASVTSNPASGSVFPVGTTTVTHTATDNAGNTSEGTHTVTVSLVLDIDIKPGSDVNPLNLNGNGVVPMAILGSDVLDVTTINVSTVSINGSTPAHNGHIEDVNDDGVADLVVHLTPSDFGIDAATPSGTVLTLTLTGEFNDETAFSGQDDVRINGNNENSKGKGGKGPK